VHLKQWVKLPERITPQQTIIRAENPISLATATDRLALISIVSAVIRERGANIAVGVRVSHEHSRFAAANPLFCLCFFNA
jgi:hypothetical protein